MPNGWERTMSYTAWTGDTAESGDRIGLYVGSHDPESRLKMMPVYCSGTADARVAGLRAIHIPNTFGDGSDADFVLP